MLTRLLHSNFQNTVGRGVDVTYQLLSPSCPLMISRLHCTFTQSEDGLWVVTDKKVARYLMELRLYSDLQVKPNTCVLEFVCYIACYDTSHINDVTRYLAFSWSLLLVLGSLLVIIVSLLLRVSMVFG